MKRIITIGMALLFILSVLAACDDERNTITGRCLIDKNGSYLIIITDDHYPDGMPIAMDNHSGNEALFNGLQTGDKIEITCGIVRESYPGSTDVTRCKLIEKGGIEDIPQHIYDSLKEHNWID